MDYDENDFQSQNFQLVGEDSKFSANLRSFGLPKFDLDEHLRFGSLVETEVLLGIQSQESNWIDFPSGSTAVEFSSSAAESCSISRHNNVWSEATSSESVDLLLKSVGDDEIINDKAVIMETSAKGEDGLINNNQVDLLVKKVDALNSSVMDALPTNQDVIIKDECLKKLSSPSEGQKNLLTHLQGSSQASELEESRTVFSFDPSNGINADGKISGDQYMTDENPISSSEAIEKSRVPETVLEGHVFDVLMRTNASNIDDCNSSVAASNIPLSITCRSNQDERILMETTRFSDEQNHRSVMSRSDLLYDGDHKENSMVIHSVETNNQLVPKSDALEVLKNCSDSVISEDADGFVSISCRTEPLLRDVEVVDRFFGKEDDASQLAKYEGKKFKDNSGYISSKAILKASLLAEGHRSVSEGLPDDSMEDDDVYSTRNQNSTMSSDVRGQKLVTCLDDLSNEHCSEGQMTDVNITDACASRLLTESNASIQDNHEIQVVETGDRMNAYPPGITGEKNVYVVEVNTAEDMDVVRQEIKLDAGRDITPDEASLLSVVLEAEAKSSPFTFKEGKSAFDLAEVHMAQVDALDNMKSSLTCTAFCRVSSGMVSNVVEKVQDTSIADQQTAEDSPLDGLSRNKLAQKEFDSDPLPLDFEKPMHPHLPPPEDTTEINVVVEKKELLIEAPSTSDIIHYANKDGKLFRGPALSFPFIDLVSKKASDPASMSHSFNMEETTSPDKFSPEDSVADKLDFPVKSRTTQLPQDITSFNLALEPKEESSSFPAMPVLLVSKENEVKLSGSSKLTNSSNGVDMEGGNGTDAGSDCVQDALVNISTKNEANAVVQPHSPVKSIDFVPVQNEVPSSAVDAVRNGESVHSVGTDSHGSGEGIDNAVGSLEAFLHARNETSVFSGNACSDGKQAMNFGSSIHENCSCKSPRTEQNDQCNFAAGDFSEGQNVSAQTEDNVLIRCTNDSSQICITRTVESNPSEKQSGNPSSSDSFRECPQDNIVHPEVEVSLLESNLGASDNVDLISSAKDEIAQNPERGSNDLKSHSMPVEVRNFTSEVSTLGHLPERGVGSQRKYSSSLQSNDIPQTLKENPQGCLDEVKAPDISAKKPNKGKTKNADRVYNEKKAGSRGKTKKEATALKQSSEMDTKYFTGQHKYVGTSGKELPLVDLRENPSIDCCTIKTSSSLVGQTSSIPDLNSSSSTLFQQSFTDLQQVQLRAQIFVYGALISGIPPDEAYMMSAFGDADGGRRLWEGVWHALITKFQNQKSPISGYETPSHSRSVGTNVQSKVPGSSAAKGSSKIISSAVLNSTAPFPSPLWSLSYGNGHHANMPRGACLNFNQTASPLTPWRPSQLRQHLDASSSWVSQASHPAPWFVSSHSSALDGIKHFSTVPFTETMHATCASDLCGPHIPTIQVAPPSASMSVADPTSTTTEAVIQSETTKKRGNSGSKKHTSKSLKAGKMKGLAAEELNLRVSRTSIESIPVLSSVESLPLPSASTLLSSNSPVKVASGTPVSISMSHLISPAHYQIFGENNNQYKANLSEETCSKIELAKLRAEDAAAAAASSIKHCQAIWSQLAAQKNSGLVSQIEEKLASAAVAAAAAASVAKAAAAAAKVASDVAWQAKLMFDEAISAAKTVKTVQSPESGILDVGKKLAGLTPISILKGMDKIHESVEVISAAREAAKRRIESASVATKQAENLDAIVKAAELAAEAVAQAGTIIAMGDPLPFTLGELVDAGTEEFWKVHHGSSKNSKLSDIHAHEHVGLDNVKESAKQYDGQFSKDVQSQKAVSEGGSSSFIKCHEQLDGTGTAQGNFLSAGQERDHSVCYSGIQKGSQVEVMSDEDGLRGAWFSARVLDMKDNKAYVCYNDFSTKEGHPKEWIVLENEREIAPRIRPAHLATAMKYEGTRKRRREHLGSYICALGDHVDAWMHDRWWEGTIVEKSSGDDTKLTVQLLAKGDKLVVDAWHVRPSLVWKDGQWMEWRHSREKLPKPHEGDTPKEKRQKLGGLEAMAHSEVDAVGMGKISKNMFIDVSRKPEDSRSLNLSAKERTFSVGKNSREEITSNALKTKRSGLQKEGSRVVFGVPRPGKKRKFMEVSKHYVEDKFDKVRESSDPMKFAKYLMPQASQKFKNTSKVDKGKKPGDSKSRVGVKAENSHIQARSQAQKGHALLTASNGESRLENLENAISSFSGNSDSLDKINALKFDSSRPAEIPAIESADSGKPAPTALLSKRNIVPGSGSDLTVKAKPILNRTSKNDDKGLGIHGKAMHETAEPRRSNRRIQPTSRLLEGIQSSLIISKMPSISHEKKSSRGNVHG